MDRTNIFGKLRAAALQLKACRGLRLSGLIMVYAGVLLLVAAYLLGLTGSNALLMACLLLIGAGIAVHVLIMKRESRY